MSPEEYRERARLIEEKANEKLDVVRAAFWLWRPGHRSARYAGGIGDVLREIAISDDRIRIEEQMHAEMEALNDEFYGTD